MVTFSDLLTSPWIKNMRLVQDGEQIEIEAIATFLMIFGACMNILFIIKVKNSCAH